MKNNRKPLFKIAIFLPNLKGGGAERVNLELARALSKLGHTVEFVLVDYEGELLAEAEAEFSVVGLGNPKNWMIPFTVANYIRKNKPDAVLVSMWALTVLTVFSQFFCLRSCKFILIEHSILSNQFKQKKFLYQIFLRLSVIFGYRLAHACVGVSAGVVKDMSDLSRMPVNRFHIIYNPVPLRKEPDFEAIEHAKSFWGEGIQYKIIAVGSLKEAKNFSLLLQAIAILRENIELSLVILGEGDLRSTLEAEAQRLQIDKQVIMPGFVKDPTAYYYGADLFVLSSIREGLPTVLLEAMACGLPVVSTDCESGPAEILQNGEFGTLVPVNDAIKLAEAIEYALKNKPDIGKLRARALDFVPEIAAARYLELLK